LTSSKKAATAASGGVGKRKMGSSSSTAATVATSAVEGKVAAAVSRPLSNGAVRAAAAAVRPTRKSNVFEQFTPKQAPSPFNVEYSISDGGPTPFTQEGSSNIFGTNSVDAPTITRKKNKINARLLCLLRDDTGEQEMELFPDSSPEAAEQLADLKSYSKLNDEARRKANLAVSHVEEDDYGAEGGENGARGILVKRTKRDVVRRKYIDPAPVNNNDVITSTTLAGATPRQHRVRATVKETGSDSISTYIKSLGQHELLFKEDEVLLGRQVRILSRLEEKRQELELQLLRPPTFAQWAIETNHTVSSLKQQIRRSQRAKAAMIEANLRLVITVARQAVKRSPSARQSQSASSVNFQDACQQGIIGLTRATEKFDPGLGFRFSTYAIWWIRKEVARNVSEQSRSVRVPPGAMRKINDIFIQERVLMNELGRRPLDEELADRVGMTIDKLNFYRQRAKEVKSLDKKIDARSGKGSMSTGGGEGDGATMDIFVKDTEHPSPTELVDEQMLKDDIRRLVRTLSPREQAVIRLRFGLDEGSEPLGLTEIGAKFGVEKEQIRKIEARALVKLRQPNRSLIVRSYVSDHI
jgi:RNA polymerase primary sigma factor